MDSHKKIFIRVICWVVVIMPMNLFALTAVDWVYLSSQWKIYDGGSGSTDVSATATSWQFNLVADMNGDTDYSGIKTAGAWDLNTGFNSSDDEIIDTAAWSTAFGVFDSGSTFADAYGGKELYLIFFDSATPTVGSNIGLVYDTGNESGVGTWVSPAGALPTPTPYTLQVDPGTYAFIGGTDDTGLLANGFGTTITYVPEPGTISLFLLGLMTLGVRKFKNRK